MTFAELWSVLRYGFFPAATFMAVGIAVVFILARFVSKVRTPQLAIFLITFGALGGVLGYATGNSRQPVVGAVLSSLLTLLAATLTYLFGKEQNKQWQPLLPHCILVLVLNTFFGLFVGGTMREKREALERRYDEWRFQYQHVYVEMQKAAGLEAVKTQHLTPSQVAPPQPPR